ncbi:MAG: N-6 DNA methylase [Gemmatimonadaceae bacterium]
MPPSRYQSATPRELEAMVAADLRAALGRRGATVTQDGAARRPDIVVDAGHFAIVVEVAKRSGAEAAGEYLAIRDHRELVERELGKPVHLLFSCTRTPPRIIRAMREENQSRHDARRPGRLLFLNLESLDAVLGRLAEASADLYPNDRWDEIFNAWSDIADDVVAFERVQRIVLPEDTEFSARLRPILFQRVLAEQERLRRDVRKLEDALRQSNITGSEAMRALVYVMFIKLYEERRENRRQTNRITPRGFVEYRENLPTQDRRDYSGRTLHHLLDREIAADEQIRDTGILVGATLPDRLSDGLVEQKLLPVLDRYQFWRTHLDALGAVFEAIARRAEKDTRIGQFFTPEPIVRFAVDVVRPEPTEVVLDPAAGTGRFLAFSMERMVSRLETVRGGAPWPCVREAIEEERLLGIDVDSWIVTIAKMTMYIHGDGKSNIFQENGLFLADVPVFARVNGQSPAPPIAGQVDVCLTNPPLGAMSYRTYAEDLARRYPNLYPSASEWLRGRLPILPGEFREERQLREAEGRIVQATAQEHEAIRSGDAKREERAAQRRRAAEARRNEASARLTTGKGTYEVRGSTAKGGALFLAAIKDYLKTDRDLSAPEEWRGGRLGIVVDEAILNTQEYAQTRRFIRRHYFIKAVFSFHRDAFWYQARTTAKTSLLYLVRKPDTAVRQREPVFFAHVDHIGFTRTGKPDVSELPELLDAYLAFDAAIRASYRDAWFDEPAARHRVDALVLPGFVRVQWQDRRPPGDDAARLDYAAEAARQVRTGLPRTLAALGDYTEAVVRTPEEDPSGIYQFATIDRIWGDVRPGRLDRTEYPPGDLRLIRPGDIVISGIDLVNGSVGYADTDVTDHVVSKEFHTLVVRPEKAPEVNGRYLALLLRTPRARALIAGTVTGTSNRTRVEDIAAVLAIPLPPLPPLEQQRELASQIERALARRRSARMAIGHALTCADAAWETPGNEAATVQP